MRNQVVHEERFTEKHWKKLFEYENTYDNID